MPCQKMAWALTAEAAGPCQCLTGFQITDGGPCLGHITPAAGVLPDPFPKERVGMATRARTGPSATGEEEGEGREDMISWKEKGRGPFLSWKSHEFCSRPDLHLMGIEPTTTP